MAGVLKNRVAIACFEECANRHCVSVGCRLFGETKWEFDHGAQFRRLDLAVLDRDFVDLHDKRALARHAPFCEVIPTTVSMCAALVSVLKVYVHQASANQVSSGFVLLRCSGSGSDPAVGAS